MRVEMKNFNETEMSILNGLKDALSFAKNEPNGAKVHKVQVKDIDVKELREKLDLTQEAFADTFGFNLATVRNWEQGKRQPEGPAKVLLNVIAYNPKCVFEAIRA